MLASEPNKALEVTLGKRDTKQKGKPSLSLAYQQVWDSHQAAVSAWVAMFSVLQMNPVPRKSNTRKSYYLNLLG